MWRIAVWVFCVGLAGCVGDKKEPPSARQPLIPRADFIMENNEAFFAKPKDDVTPPPKP